MNKELEMVAGKLVETSLERSNATDYLVSILVTHLIKEGVINGEEFKAELIQQKNELIENHTEESLKTRKKVLASVIDACIGDIEAIDNKQ